MSAAEKMPLIRIEIREGGKRKLFLVPKKTATAVATLLKELEKSHKTEDFLAAEEVFPSLNDPVRGPATSFHGLRLRLGLTQKEMAEKVGISQSDVSKIEKGERAIGRKLAMRIGQACQTDYKRFL
jgi:DNA-binding XRE family transcriptional regulator